MKTQVIRNQTGVATAKKSMKNVTLNRCVLGVLGGQIKAASVEAEGRASGVSDFTLWSWMSKPASTISASAKKSPKPPAAGQNSTAPPKTSSPSTPAGQAQPPLPPKATQKAATSLGGRCGEGV